MVRWLPYKEGGCHIRQVVAMGRRLDAEERDGHASLEHALPSRIIYHRLAWRLEQTCIVIRPSLIVITPTLVACEPRDDALAPELR